MPAAAPQSHNEELADALQGLNPDMHRTMWPALKAVDLHSTSWPKPGNVRQASPERFIKASTEGGPLHDFIMFPKEPVMDTILEEAFSDLVFIPIDSWPFDMQQAMRETEEGPSSPKIAKVEFDENFVDELEKVANEWLQFQVSADYEGNDKLYTNL